MAATKASDRAPDLREFIKENDQRVYDFCSYLLAADFSVEELVLTIFRDFGEFYRRSGFASGGEATANELRVELFRMAWNRVHASLHQAYFPTLAGRDTRLLKGLDDDLLPGKNESKEKLTARIGPRAKDRLIRVDSELRAPVVLRDILKFEDEEVAQILGLRWGVYRHRLHRGRLDFKDALKGLPTAHALTRGADV